MDFQLGEDTALLVDNVRQFCQHKVVPHAALWDQSERFPSETVRELADLGLMGLEVPESHGGVGLDTVAATCIVEELAAADASLALTVASHNALATGHILLSGSEGQKRRLLPELASGRALGAWAFGEPGADMTGRRDGGSWVLDGRRHAVTQGSVAGIIVVLAVTDADAGKQGLTGFIVPRQTAGLSVARSVPTLGVRASDTADLVFDGVRIPGDHQLGELGGGFGDALRLQGRSRIGVAALGCGVGRAARDRAAAYAKEREQFGKPIAGFQAIQWKIADMTTEIEAAWLLTLRAASLRDAGQPFATAAAHAKLYAARAATRACHQAIQIHGGYGYTREFPVERYLRDARLCGLAEGTSEVQQLVIARDIVKRFAT